jgi:hypothetical protein
MLEGNQVETTQCAECGTALAEGSEYHETDDGCFCHSCFGNLTGELQQAVTQSTVGINYPMAIVGGVAGALLGAVAWWGFTVVSNISLGLFAVVIGYACGKGVVILSGHKRHLNLQIISAAITVVGYVYASYLVGRTFTHRYYAAEGQELVLPLLPSPDLLLAVVRNGFGIMDLVFVGIAVYQAWMMPAPFKITADS